MSRQYTLYKHPCHLSPFHIIENDNLGSIGNDYVIDNTNNSQEAEVEIADSPHENDGCVQIIACEGQ